MESFLAAVARRRRDAAAPSRLLLDAVSFLHASASAPLPARLDFLRRRKGLSDEDLEMAVDMLEERTPKHVVFCMPGEAPGHVNPLLPLMRQLRGSDVEVSVFADGRATAAREGEVSDDSAMGRAIRSTGASLAYYCNDGRLNDVACLTQS